MEAAWYMVFTCDVDAQELEAGIMSFTGPDRSLGHPRALFSISWRVLSPLWSNLTWNCSCCSPFLLAWWREVSFQLTLAVHDGLDWAWVLFDLGSIGHVEVGSLGVSGLIEPWCWGTVLSNTIGKQNEDLCLNFYGLPGLAYPFQRILNFDFFLDFLLLIQNLLWHFGSRQKRKVDMFSSDIL